MRTVLDHHIRRNPEPEGDGTITINANVVGYNPTFTASPASNLVVKSLIRKIYEKVSSTGETTCAICLKEFINGESRVVNLPCGHDFDDECLLTWFKTNHTCPLCRFKLPCEDQY
ncbi:PREDICTED: E3 ubiquitin-protein ligase RNF181-like [Camelina sativa]|uniref:RING-type E3 ubiquitin transferase n=1 Tax=Camelina sativa TaxID=90675 RepID=A0ABM1R8M6_CAMSA|nr:PREDICTED: E3 ubiquitin-protein ligase RNF181-like [Camelina sativa]